MKSLLEHIVNNDFVKANESLNEQFKSIVENKLFEKKKMYAAKLTEQVTVDCEGMVHTASGERLLPSVYKQRRGLVEEKHESDNDNPKNHIKKSKDKEKYHPYEQPQEKKKIKFVRLNPANDNPANQNLPKPANDLKEETEKIHDANGKLLGTIMTITGSNDKNPTKTVKKYRAETVSGKTLITADKKAALQHLGK